MRSTFIRRLDEIEARETDWIAKLNVIDYIGLTNYSDGNWDELYFDETITVVRNKNSGEIRGIFADRRTDDEIRAAGGDLAYL